LRRFQTRHARKVSITVYDRNGKVDSRTSNISTGGHLPSTDYQIGAPGWWGDGDNKRYKGELDEVRVYTHYLTEKEMEFLYSNPGGTGRTTISGGQIDTGSLTADAIATNAITATEANFQDLNAVAASISNWTIESNRLSKGNLEIGFNLETVQGLKLGTFNDPWIDKGLYVEGSNGSQARISIESGEPGISLYGDGNNYVTLGWGHGRSNSGITVQSGGKDILYTTPSTAYIDNLKVRNGAIIDGGVTVDGGFSGDQIDVTDLSAVNTSTGSLDVNGTLTMNGGKITNGSDYSINADGIRIESSDSYFTGNAINFVENLSDNPLFSDDIGRIWFNSSGQGEFVINQVNPASGRLLLQGRSSTDILSLDGPIKFFPTNSDLDSGEARITEIENNTFDGDDGQNGVGLVFTPYELEYSFQDSADKGDLEQAMNPNEGIIYAVRKPGGNINFAWAETDSNGNIQNRSTTF